MKKYSYLISLIFIHLCAIAGSCNHTGDRAATATIDSLRISLSPYASFDRGKVGIAVISPEGDTLTVNNDAQYPLMSVFKLHQALAVAHSLDMKGASLDSIVTFSRSELNADTWSPMYKAHTEEIIRLPMRELTRYILQESDNNASNLLFDRFVSVAECDDFIRRATGIDEFKLTYTEHDMQGNHVLANYNHSSPMACALLIDRLFADSIVSPQKQNEIIQIMLDCKTGTDRIYAPLAQEIGVRVAHKTGSGYRTPDGLLAAHNDAGRILLPDGRAYTLAVLVKDFKGSEAEASEVIANVSEIVYNAFKHR